MSTFVISCGGTGGHLSPGISLAKELTVRGHRCLLIVSKKQVDSRLVANHPELEFVRAPGAGFSLHPWRFIKFAIQQIASIIFSFRLILRNRPDTVLAFGGFLTLGVALASFVRGCPFVLHEANRKPGRATRLLRGLADRIYLPDGIPLAGVHPMVIKYAGYPLREEIRLVAKEEARKKLGLDIQGKLLVVLGGSQGALRLNNWVRENIEGFGTAGINVYCVTGLNKGSDGVTEYRAGNGQVVKAFFTDFTDQMGTVLSSADLVVSRAGAGVIAEMTHCHVPSILVPYPYAADNHQDANSRFLEQQGGCVVVEQSRIDSLFAEVSDLIFNDWLLEKFNQNLQRLERRNSAESIADDLEEISGACKNQRNPKTAVST